MEQLSSTSRRTSLTLNNISRRSSLASDLDVFSDDHALPSPTESFQDSLLSTHDRVPDFSEPPRLSLRHSSTLARYPSVPGRQSDAGSTVKRSLMIDDQPSSLSTGLDRSFSTSSRTTVPRAPSPYNGPTAPSQPYSMFNQVTRSSSIASESTIRPHAETPFVPRGGPEHPYSLYPQNVVPEEEDEDITAHGIPIGFPSVRNFQNQAGPGNSEVGDIVSSDGHIEQLPPYSRYADNTVDKGDMQEINARRNSQRLRRLSSPGDSSSAPVTSMTTNEEAPLNPQDEAAEAAAEADRPRTRAEATRRRLRRTACCGLPLWIVLVLGAGIIAAGIVGGVVGGVIGARQGAQRAYAQGATTTIWLDALPTTVGPGSPPLPTGQYEIPLNQTEEIKNCIAQPWLVPAWGCMDIAYIGVNITQPPTGPMQAIFEDFSTNTQNFKYGPQPPDFNDTSFNLLPFHDKDDSNYGVAMFFSAYFDKLSIIPEDCIEPPPPPSWPGTSSVNRRDLQKKAAKYDGAPLKPSDRPWFCFWNGTVNEFFVYISEAAPTSPTSSTDAWPGAAMTTSMPPGNTVQAQHITAAPTSTPTPTTFQAWAPLPPTSTEPLPKRSYETGDAQISNYPRLVKMVEKRMPSNNIAPYCQKMQVLDNYQIEPIQTVPTIAIDEIEYATATASASGAQYSQNNKRHEPKSDDAQIDFESNCICEWLSY